MFWTRENFDKLAARLENEPVSHNMARDFACDYDELIVAAARVVLHRAQYDIAKLEQTANRYNAPKVVYEIASYELFALQLNPSSILQALAPNRSALIALREKMGSSFKYKTIAAGLRTEPGYTYQLYREARLVLAELDYVVNWENTTLKGNMEHLMRTWRLEYKFKYVLAFRLSENGRGARAGLLNAYAVPMPSMKPPPYRGEAYLAYAARAGSKRAAEGERPAEDAPVEDDPNVVITDAARELADRIILDSLFSIITKQREQIANHEEEIKACRAEIDALRLRVDTSLFEDDPARVCK